MDFSMPFFFVSQYKTMRTVRKHFWMFPVIKKVCGGFIVFRTVADYEAFKSQI